MFILIEISAKGHSCACWHHHKCMHYHDFLFILLNCKNYGVNLLVFVVWVCVYLFVCLFVFP